MIKVCKSLPPCVSVLVSLDPFLHAFTKRNLPRFSRAWPGSGWKKAEAGVGLPRSSGKDMATGQFTGKTFVKTIAMFFPVDFLVKFTNDNFYLMVNKL